MAVKPFDLERLRHNWDRLEEIGTAPLPERLVEVRAPADPYPDLRSALARIGTLARERHPRRMTALSPFLEDAAGLLDRMEAASSPGPDAKVADTGALKEQLRKVLDDLEDLFEVYAGIGLR